MKIEYLADYDEHLAAVADWQQAEFGYLNPSLSIEHRRDRLRSCLQKNSLPLAVIALDEAGVPVGAASLLAATVTHMHLSPWLSTVVVSPEARGKGVASALSLRIAEEAARPGFETIYLFTPHNESLYARIGWKTIEKSTHAGRSIAIMVRATNA